MFEIGKVMPKISVIVPVYNQEKFLKRCVDSILSQTFTDFELLLIDDGSTDDSAMMCDEYAKVDHRIKVFHKLNGGVSSARNLGLDNAKGIWVTFVDSDDYVSETYLGELEKNSNDVDLVVCGALIVSDNTNSFPPSMKICKADDLSFLDEQLCYSYFRAPWAKLLKNDIIKKHSLRFALNLRVGEDTDFILSYLFWIKRISFVNIPSYCYTGNWFDAIHRYAMNIVDLHKHLFYILNNLSALKNELKYEFPLFNAEIKYYFRRLYFTYLTSKVPSYNELKKELKSFRTNNGVYYDKSKIKEEIMTFLFRYCPFITYLLLHNIYKDFMLKK